MNDLKRFSLRSVSDFLSEQEMKSVTGGYDPGYGGGYSGFGGYEECCFCSYVITWTGGSHSGSGGFCGHWGDPDCWRGLDEWRKNMFNLYGEDIDIDLNCG